MSKITDSRSLLSLSYGYWSAPFRGTPPCGDAATIQQTGKTVWLLVLDAMGHGPVAARIAQRVISIFDAALKSDFGVNYKPAQLLNHIHTTLFTRHQDEQAALGLFNFNLPDAQMDIAMVGNLDAFLLNPTNSIRLHSQNGMVGGLIPPRLKETSYPLVANSVLGVFSDGMRFNDIAAVLPTQSYPVFGRQPLQTAAKALVERFRRQHDDSSCALVRIEQLNDG